MNGRPEPKVLLMQLSERTSAKGTRYLSGFLGKAKLVAFLDQAPDRYGNPQWSVYASEPAPRGDQVAGDRTAGAGDRAGVPRAEFFTRTTRVRPRERAAGDGDFSDTNAGARARARGPAR